MGIRAAIVQLVAIQGALSITVPIAATIKKAYKYHPPMKAALPDTPCFANSWTMVKEEREFNLRWQEYTVNMQLFVHDADEDQAADIATAFHDALVDGLDAKVTLNGSVTQQFLRGGSPTLVLFNRANIEYIGLNLFLDVEIKEAKEFGA